MPRPADADPPRPPDTWQGPVIGVVRTPYDAKFGAPRQPGLAPAAEGRIHLHPPFDRQEALRGLEQCSHLWLIYGFHQVPPVTDDGASRLTVRPPRLGGNERVGVFATRSPFRPHPIGLSVVRLLSLHPGRDGRHKPCGHLRVAGVDLVDGTPLLDIKPYLPWADAIPDAHCHWAGTEPEGLVGAGYEVSPPAAAALARIAARRPGFAALLEQTLRADPRPSYHVPIPEPDRRWRMTLDGVEVGWRVDGSGIHVDELSFGDG